MSSGGQTMRTRRDALRHAFVVGGGLAILQACAPGSSPAGPTAAPAGAPAQSLTKIRISCFNPPSNGSFLPPVIKQFDLDKANGLDLDFTYKPSDTYNVDFAAGQDEVGGSSTLISEARRVNQGVQVRYLFNVFTFNGSIVTERPDITTLKDLEGKTLAADTVTTAWAMMRFFLIKAGVEVTKIQVQSQQTAGMVALLQAQRIDAAAAPEPTTSVILEQGPGRFRILPIFDENVWRSLAGTASVAYLGVAAQNRWIEANKDAVPRLFATYAAAVKWSNEHPADAGQVIGGATKLEPKALEMAITSGRMAFDVSPASQLKQSIEAVLDAGIQTQQLEQKPRVEDLIYDGL